MKRIEFERWEPDAENPRRLKYAGQHAAEEVYQELKARLDSVGYLPDEYLLLDNRWQNGREMPRDAGFFCRTDYGGSEGIYLDVFLDWYEDGQHKTEHFMTGKTLGESGADLDRMSLISSAITKAVRGDNIVHARYMVVGAQPEPEETMSLNLSPDEQAGRTGTGRTAHPSWPTGRGRRKAPAPYDRKRHRVHGRGGSGRPADRK